MNPGVWIMGGGGGGGGRGGRGGRGLGGKQGAGGANGGEGADADGRSACGSNGTDGARCPNHHGSGQSGSMTQGDPVDVVTGRVFTDPVIDVFLPGPLPLVIERSYSSAARERDVGLGFGVSHSLAWEIEERRRTLIVWTGDGTSVELPRIPEGEAVLGPDGWLVHRLADSIAIDFIDGIRYIFNPAKGAAPLRTLRLEAIENPQSARITLLYDGGVLRTIVDSAGREVSIRRASDGRIEQLEVRNAPAQGRWVVLASYRYDDSGRLIAAIDADGNESRYTYDDRNLLTAFERPNGLTFFFRYDDNGRCVETWGEYPGRADPSLAEDVPAVLADHTTAARGVHHVTIEYFPDGGSQATDSLTTFRYDANEDGKVERAVMGGAVFSRMFNDEGHLVAFTDALGATTRFRRDARGRLLEEIDPLGGTTMIERDVDGTIRRIIDHVGAETTIERVDDGFLIRDAIGALLQVRYDDRGLLAETIGPDGARTTFHYDAHGNLVEQRSFSGAVTRFDWDGLGRCIGVRDASGAYTAFRYSAAGRLLSVKEADGNVIEYEYDSSGNRTAVIDARGRTTFSYGGLDRVCEVIEPNGARIQYRYDREGRLVLVRNQLGEEHRITRRLDGCVLAERTFDGRTIRRGFDAMGRVAWMEHGPGERIHFERDACGRVTKRLHADGLEETFEYDLRGDMTAATRGNVRVTFDRNALGWIVRERQEVDGNTVDVVLEYDTAGRLVGRRTSLGHVARWTRAADGRTARVSLDGAEALVAFDVLGRETHRALGGGGRIEKAFDAMGRLVGVRAAHGSTGADGRSIQPDWVGSVPRGVTADLRYTYAPAPLLASARKNARELRYEYDAKSRLSRVIHDDGRRQEFRYDAAGSLFEAGLGAPRRSYGSGGALAAHGETIYRRDACNRVIQAETRRPDGAVDVTRYRWSTDGMLTSVELPDGSVVEHDYDPFARRMRKRVKRPAEQVVRQETRFVWEATELVHEIRRASDANGDPVIEERTYCFEEKRTAPWAHREAVVRGGEREDRGWFHYLNDDTGAPELLIDDRGEVAAVVDLSPWGMSAPSPEARASTPVRFRGQYADEETGLCYNRYRFYEPATGRYMSPDPIGLLGGLDPFGYADNCPTSAVDPDGLMYSVIRDRNGRIVTDAENLGAGGGVTNMDPALRNRGFRDSCAETGAVNNLSRQIRAGNPGMSDEQVRAEVRRRFADEGYTIETFEGNREDFTKRSRRENEAARVDPCPYCAAMINNLGIGGGVIGATNDRNTGRWDGRTTYRAQRKSGGGRRGRRR
jgi:RHS repeat-associated protein